MSTAKVIAYQHSDRPLEIIHAEVKKVWDKVDRKHTEHYTTKLFYGNSESETLKALVERRELAKEAQKLLNPNDQKGREVLQASINAYQEAIELVFMQLPEPKAVLPPGWIVRYVAGVPEQYEITAPNGYVGVVSSIAKNPSNLLFMLAQAFHAQAVRDIPTDLEVR